MQKIRFLRIKPWFYSSTWHSTLGTTIGGHWALCSIISTYLQLNQIKPDFAGPHMIGLQKDYKKPNYKKPRGANLGMDA